MSHDYDLDPREAYICDRGNLNDYDEELAYSCDDDYDDDYDYDGQPDEYTEWQDYMGGDDWDHGQYDEY